MIMPQIPFIKRDDDIQKIANALRDTKHSSQNILIYGPSGTGKTTLAQIALDTLFEESNRSTICYINLTDDLISTSAFLEVFLYTMWSGNVNNREVMLKVSMEDSMSHFLKSKLRYRKIAKMLLNSVSLTVSAIPFYGAQVGASACKFGDAIGDSGAGGSFDKIEYICQYIKHITRTGVFVFIVDNYQFMNSSVKRAIEGGLNLIDKNCAFITIYRTDHIPQEKPTCFANCRAEIELSAFLMRDTVELFKKVYPCNGHAESAARDCFYKTNGNLKEIELYIKSNHENIQNGILRVDKTCSLRAALKELPDLQRNLVLLATMFPSGLRMEYVMHLLNQLYANLDPNFLRGELEKLITLGYVVLNSERNDLLKPAHDKVSLSIEKVRSDEEFLTLYHCVEDCLEALVKQRANDGDYVYLLHCFVGVCTAQRMIRQIKYLAELLTIEHSRCAYAYIAQLATELSESEGVILRLPSNCIELILDSCQKTSEFPLGLQIISELRLLSPSLSTKNQIYSVKYLTQMYDFNNALKEADELPESTEALLYKLIILQHMGKDLKAEKLVKELIADENATKDNPYYVILRNSAHYFTYSEALTNLNAVLKYFMRNGSRFEQATARNNLSVIHIWNGKKTFIEAEQQAQQAIKLLDGIQSNEVFEPLCNLSVLYYLKGEYMKAVEYATRSLDTVPLRLRLDVAILEMNRDVFDCALGKISAFELCSRIQGYYEKPHITKDPWVEFQVTFNLYHLQKALTGYSDLSPNQEYVHNKSHFTRFEVATVLDIENMEIPITLSLSPNWRY